MVSNTSAEQWQSHLLSQALHYRSKNAKQPHQSIKAKQIRVQCLLFSFFGQIKKVA